MKQETLKENNCIIGKITIRKFRAGTGELVAELTFRNLVVTGTGGYGRNIIARRLGSDNTYSLNVTHGEIGTGTNAPANGDTALQTPSTRVATTLATITNNIVNLQFFFSDATLPNGTYREFGTFIDGTSTLGSGRLFNRALFSTAYAKASGEDTTVEVEFTVN